jgi:hypothetical protein
MAYTLNLLTRDGSDSEQIAWLEVVADEEQGMSIIQQFGCPRSGNVTVDRMQECDALFDVQLHFDQALVPVRTTRHPWISPSYQFQRP